MSGNWSGSSKESQAALPFSTPEQGAASPFDISSAYATILVQNRSTILRLDQKTRSSKLPVPKNSRDRLSMGARSANGPIAKAGWSGTTPQRDGEGGVSSA